MTPPLLASVYVTLFCDYKLRSASTKKTSTIEFPLEVVLDLEGRKKQKELIKKTMLLHYLNRANIY